MQECLLWFCYVRLKHKMEDKIAFIKQNWIVSLHRVSTYQAAAKSWQWLWFFSEIVVFWLRLDYPCTDTRSWVISSITSKIIRKMFSCQDEKNPGWLPIHLCTTFIWASFTVSWVSLQALYILCKSREWIFIIYNMQQISKINATQLSINTVLIQC